MTDDTVNELANHTLELLRRLSERIARLPTRDELDGALATLRDELKRDIEEVRIGVATVSANLNVLKADVADIKELKQDHGARLNAIDERLAIIEKHIGMVKA